MGLAEDDAWAGAYPINALRHCALERVRTERVLILDVDFAFPDGARRRLEAAAIGARDALVVPAFEVAPGVDAASRAALLAAVAAGDAAGFHVSGFPRGHGPTDFARWLSEAGTVGAGTSYAAAYAEGFEPYVVARVRGLPRFDARFRGYGLNKLSHALALHRAGFAFPVAGSSAFVFAEEHARSPEWRRNYDARAPEYDPSAKLRVQALYDLFKAELDAPKDPRRDGAASAALDAALDALPDRALAIRVLAAFAGCLAAARAAAALAAAAPAGLRAADALLAAVAA